MLHFNGPVVRPPQEDYRQFIEVTVGCTHNSCRFCNFYRDFPFRMAPLEQVESDLREVYRVNPGQRYFWANGGNPYALSTEKLAPYGELFQKYFPGAEIAAYSRVSDVKNKSVEDILRLKALGFDNLVIGVETGDDEVLKRMNKGYAAQDIVTQLGKLDQAKIRYRIVYLGGLAGRGKCVESARKSIDIFNQIHPTLIGTTSLAALPGTELCEEMRAGKFEEASEKERQMEYRTLFAGLKNHVQVVDGPYWTYLGEETFLPEDREALLARMDRMIAGITEEEEKWMYLRRHSMRTV